MFGEYVGRTTITLSEETRKRLCVVEGRMMLRNGKPRSAEDVVKELIEFYERNQI